MIGRTVESWTTRYERSVARGVAITHPISVSHAEGSRVWDTQGRVYLDFTSGIGTLNVGHRHPRVVEAVRAQLEHLTHTCFQVAPYDVYVELCERLCSLVAGPTALKKKALLLTTGA